MSTPLLLSASLALLAGKAYAQVTATGTNGPTNPAQPTYAAIGSTIDQSSMSRLISLDAVDDFCIYAPPTLATVSDDEAIVVAYCTKPRNGARLIPDGTITQSHFVKTPMYVQINGLWDGTKLNIVAGDTGGELDPHGATGEGNPVGGNVTSNVSGEDVFYQEWMSFVASDQFCLRVCTNETPEISAAVQCEHTLDLLGCNWVMAIPYDDSPTFTSCDGDAAEPPGLYPLANGSTSTFEQRYTGTYTIDGPTPTTGTWTQGETITPENPYSYPASSNCITYSSIANGVGADLVVTASPTPPVAIGSGGGGNGTVAFTVTGVNGTTSAASSTTAMNSTTSNSGTLTFTGAASTSSSSHSSSASSGSSSAASSTSHAGAMGLSYRLMGSEGLISAIGISLVMVVAGAAVLL